MATKSAPKKPAPKKPTPKKPATKPPVAQLKKAIEEATFLSEHDKKYYLESLREGRLKDAPTLDRYDIQKYPPLTHNCPADERLYDSKSGKFLPFEVGTIDLYEMLDTLTYACQHGKLNSRNWVKTVFHSEETLSWFLEELASYNDCYRIHDQWWYALATLCEHQHVEEGFISSEEISDSLREHIEETNQVF